MASQDTDAQEFLDMCKDILKESQYESCNEAYRKIIAHEIDGDLDILLRQIQEILPFHLIIPSLRELLGFVITNDETCIKQLTTIREHVKDKLVIDATIEFLKGEDLDEDVVPEIDLTLLASEIPRELIPSLMNCVDYIHDVSDFDTNIISE